MTTQSRKSNSRASARLAAHSGQIIVRGAQWRHSPLHRASTRGSSSDSCLQRRISGDKQMHDSWRRKTAQRVAPPALDLVLGRHISFVLVDALHVSCFISLTFNTSSDCTYFYSRFSRSFMSPVLLCFVRCVHTMTSRTGYRSTSSVLLAWEHHCARGTSSLFHSQP